MIKQPKVDQIAETRLLIERYFSRHHADGFPVIDGKLTKFTRESLVRFLRGKHRRPGVADRVLAELVHRGAVHSTDGYSIQTRQLDLDKIWLTVGRTATGSQIRLGHASIHVPVARLINEFPFLFHLVRLLAIPCDAEIEVEVSTIAGPGLRRELALLTEVKG